MAVIDFVKRPTKAEKLNRQYDFVKAPKSPKVKLDEEFKKLEEDKAKLEEGKAELQEAVEAQEKPKKKGRPFGSKNKLKVEDATIRDNS